MKQASIVLLTALILATGCSSNDATHDGATSLTDAGSDLSSSENDLAVSPDLAVGMTLTGTVVTSIASPLSNAAILIRDALGDKAIVYSDANGTFSVPGVTPPYTAIVRPTSGLRFVVYQGLTRLDPTLQDAAAGVAAHKASISGNLSPALSITSGQEADVLVASTGRFYNVYSSVGALSSYSIAANAVNWFGPDTVSSPIFILQHNPSNFTYQAFGYGTIDLVAGQMITQNLTTTTTIPTATLSATTSFPSGYTLVFQKPELSVGANTSFFLGANNTTSMTSPVTTSFNVPNLSMPTQSTINFMVQATSQSSLTPFIEVMTTGFTSNASPSITIPIAPTYVAPGLAATGIDHSSSFSWMAAPSTVSVVDFAPIVDTSQPSIRVVTSGTSTTIPNLGAFSAGPSATQQYNWVVRTFGTYDDLDAAAGQYGYDVYTSRAYVDRNQNYLYAISDSGSSGTYPTFTTAATF